MSLRTELYGDRFDIDRFCLMTRMMTTSIEHYLIRRRNKDAASDRAVIVNSEGGVDCTVGDDLQWRS